MCTYLLHVMIEFRFHHLHIPVMYLSKSYFTHKREPFSNSMKKMWSVSSHQQAKQTKEKTNARKQNTQTSFYACTWSKLRAMFAIRLCRAPGRYGVKRRNHHQKPCICMYPEPTTLRSLCLLLMFYNYFNNLKTMSDCCFQMSASPMWK